MPFTVKTVIFVYNLFLNIKTIIFFSIFFSLPSQMVMTDVSGTRGAVCLQI